MEGGELHKCVDGKHIHVWGFWRLMYVRSPVVIMTVGLLGIEMGVVVML